MLQKTKRTHSADKSKKNPIDTSKIYRVTVLRTVEAYKNALRNLICPDRVI